MHTLTADFHRTTTAKPGPILAGLDAYSFMLAGRLRRHPSVVLGMLDTAHAIDAQSSTWKKMTNQDLRAKLGDLQEAFRRRARGYESLLPEALGALREAAERSLGLRPFIVQLAGAIALYRGTIAEMATGEGKTLTAPLAAILWGWSGLPVHIITVNDYLADRDAKKTSALYAYAGLSVGCVTGEMDQAGRKAGYGKDITYTTSKEIVADFLRDRIFLSSFQLAPRRQIRTYLGFKKDIERGLVMRGIHSAIVDEADSILIDEAVTPLIISRPQPNQPFVDACKAANDIADILIPNVDYRIDLKYKEIELLPALDDHVAGHIEQIPALFRGPQRRRELLRQALNAREFFLRDFQYVINNDKVVIVDEFTGRMMQQRTWRAGLHQLIEAKEKMPITPPSETLARLSFQRFFRLFSRLSGMTGTAMEAADELWHIYKLPVLAIPTNRPCQRTVHPRRIFVDQESKWRAIVDDIVDMNKKGRPVLVGTRSVKASEELAARLSALNLPCRVLNAVRHREEAEIVSHAGEPGTITVATNMAGRGTDIILDYGVAQRGGLHVIASECHESGRIDRQLFGRAARQGDPGSARSFVCWDDELLCRYLPAQVRTTIKNLLLRKTPYAEWAGDKAVKWAQNAAQRLAFRRRRSVLKMDTWLDDSLSFAQNEAG
jgi:preprotein translocase subunit SecA